MFVFVIETEIARTPTHKKIEFLFVTKMIGTVNVTS